MAFLESTFGEPYGKVLYDYRNIQVRHPLKSQIGQRKLGVKYQIYLKTSHSHDIFGGFDFWDFAEACHKLFGENHALISDYTSIAQNPYALGCGPIAEMPDWYHSNILRFRNLYDYKDPTIGFEFCFLTKPEQLTLFMLGYGDKLISY